MIYLSCIELDLKQSAARRWLDNPYRIHQRLLTAWPDGAAGRVLYRIEVEREPARILVQSPAEADWEKCFAGLPILCGTPRQKRMELVVAPGQRLRFFLRANPTVRRLRFDEKDTSPRDRMTGQRVALLREEEQLEWLQRKAEAAGFAILTADARDRGEQVSYRPSSRSRLTHQSVDFEGRLQVTDSRRLLDAVVMGIGSAKGFGFGLLSLAPAA